MPLLNALPDVGPGGVPKGAAPGLVRRRRFFFSVSYCVGKALKICECVLATPSFHCIGGGSVPPPNHLPDAGPGGALKGVSPSLDGGANASFWCRFVLAKC